MIAQSLLKARELEAILTEHGTRDTLPAKDTVQQASASIIPSLPLSGLGEDKVADHLVQQLVPGFNGSSLSPHYYGFVTGGATPIARLADHIVSVWDQNVCIHLPSETITTAVDDGALSMLLELFSLPRADFPARVFTTGATASNILGLACGRDYVVAHHLAKAGHEYEEEEGLLSACLRAGIKKIQILSTMPHSSLGKAASIVGIGSKEMIDVSTEGHPLKFDMFKLEEYLSTSNTASIVAISCAEVNTGSFTTSGLAEIQEIRYLCDRYSAWLHVDAAFGIFACLLPTIPAYEALRAGVEGLELADSITGDGHKLLNVPYDTGFFFSRHSEISSRVFQNPNAPYLKATSADGIVSPMTMGLENSRRFRALPVYANLTAYGKEGYAKMIVRMVELARAVARFIDDECEHLELLPRGIDFDHIYMVVMFRAKDDALNAELVTKIKASRKVYSSGTKWEGKPAARFAIAKWDVDVERDLEIVKDVLRNLV